MQPATHRSASKLSELTPGTTLVLGWRAFTAEALEELGQNVTYVMAPCDVDTALRQGFGGDIVVVPDPTNVEHVLAGLERHDVDLKSFTAVGTNLEHALVAAAVVGDMSRARSLSPHSAVLLRDKVAQKHTVRRAGLPVADCFTVDTLLNLPVSDSAYPLVVKPLAGAGTTNTFVLASAQEAVLLQASRPGKEGYGPWAVEEFVDGAELQIDGVIRDGRLLALTVSRYLQNLLIAIKTGGLVGTVLLEPSAHADLYAQARDLVSRALAALGHTNGVFHLEAFRQSDRLVFSECAGRTSGGVVREKLQEKYGFDLVTEWARALLGLPSAIPVTPPSELCYGSVNLLAEPGEIVSVPDAQRVLALPGVVRASVEVGPGDVAGEPSVSSNTKAGRIVVAAQTEDAVEQLLKSAAAWFTSQTIVKKQTIPTTSFPTSHRKS
ncbi:hypothetical protein ABZ864_41070 [Streptomyces sp. NPDC047082]|uniref:ATP-grasp domain-containing protein n=1 Tax=Streptomyces sp. NPDC047082 TaxID=3155259 RepID=UPI0033FE18D1